MTWKGKDFTNTCYWKDPVAMSHPANNVFSSTFLYIQGIKYVRADGPPPVRYVYLRHAGGMSNEQAYKQCDAQKVFTCVS